MRHFRLLPTALLLFAVNAPLQAREDAEAVTFLSKQEMTAEQALQSLLNYPLPEDTGYGARQYATELRKAAICIMYIQARSEEERQACLAEGMKHGEYEISSLLIAYNLLNKGADATREQWENALRQLENVAEHDPKSLTLLCGIISSAPHLSPEEKQARIRRCVLTGSEQQATLPLMNAAITLLFNEYGAVEEEKAEKVFKKAVVCDVLSNGDDSSETSRMWSTCARLCQLKGEAFRPLEYGARVLAVHTGYDANIVQETYNLAHLWEQLSTTLSFDKPALIRCLYEKAAYHQHPAALYKLHTLATDENEKQSYLKAAHEAGWQPGTDYTETAVKRIASAGTSLQSPLTLITKRDRLLCIDMISLLSKAANSVTPAQLRAAESSSVTADIATGIKIMKSMSVFAHEEYADVTSNSAELRHKINKAELKYVLSTAQFTNNKETIYAIYLNGIGESRAGYSPAGAANVLEELAAKPGSGHYFTTWALNTLRYGDPKQRELALSMLRKAYEVGEPRAVEFYCNSAIRGEYGIPGAHETKQEILNRGRAAMAEIVWKESLPTAKTPEDKLIVLMSLVVKNLQYYEELDAALIEYATLHPETADMVENMRMMYAKTISSSAGYPWDEKAYTVLEELLDKAYSVINDDERVDYFKNYYRYHKEYSKFVTVKKAEFDLERTKALNLIKRGKHTIAVIKQGRLAITVDGKPAEALRNILKTQPYELNNAILAMQSMDKNAAESAIAGEVGFVAVIEPLSPDVKQLLQQHKILILEPCATDAE